MYYWPNIRIFLNIILFPERANLAVAFVGICFVFMSDAPAKAGAREKGNSNK